MGAKPKLNAAQVRYLERAARVRRKLSNKALAAKFGLDQKTVRNYIQGTSLSLEDWQDRRVARGFAP